MTTRHILFNVMRLLVAAAGVVTASGCGSELLRTGHGPVYLSILSMQASSTGGSGSANLLSDVATAEGSIFNDLGSATIAAELKNDSSTATTPIQSVTITRYRVSFRRADGRNTPGVDVPFGFDGATSVTIPARSTAVVTFDIVRHANKLEPPLRNMVGLGGQLVISTVAEVTFFGRDQNGNEVMVTGSMDVTFGDFPDA